MAELLSEVEYGRILGSFTAVTEDFGDTVAPDSIPLSGTVTFTPSHDHVSYINSAGETASLYVSPVSATILNGRLVGSDGKDGVQLLATNSNNVSASVLWTARISINPIFSGAEAPANHDFLIEVKRGEISSLIDVIKANSRVHNIALFNDAIAEAAAKFWERVEAGEFRGNQGPPGPAGGPGIGVPGPVGVPGRVGVDGAPGVGGNIIPDGDLESPGFLVSGDYVESTDAVSGEKSARLSNATSRKIRLEPEKSYVGSVYMKSEEPTAVSITQRVFGNEGDISRVIENVYNLPADTWRKVTFLLDSDVGDQSLEIITSTDGRTITVDHYTLSDNSVVQGLQRDLTAAQTQLEAAMAQLDLDIAYVDSERERLAGSLNDLAVVLEDADVDLTELYASLDDLKTDLVAEEARRQEADEAAQEVMRNLDQLLAQARTDLAANEEIIDNLGIDLGASLEEIQKSKSKIEFLETDTLPKMRLALEEADRQAREDLATLTGLLEGLDTALAENDTVVNDLRDNIIPGIQTNLSANNGVLEELDSTLATAKSDLQQVETDLATERQDRINAVNAAQETLTDLDGKLSTAFPSGVFDVSAELSNTIRNSVVEYAVSSSETNAPTTGWSTATPVRSPGRFIWFRSVITYADDTTSISNPALLTGNTGAPGEPGADGKGVTIKGSFELVSQLPPQGATGDAYMVAGDLYVWDETGTRWKNVGQIQGPQGIPGEPGENGQSFYTWLKYADTPTSGMSDSPAGKTYMGLAYNKVSPLESDTYGDYTWSLIKGEDGVPGEAGSSLFTWVKYADTATGGGMADIPDGKKYIGLAYNKATASESSVASDYTWSLIQGPKGDPGSQGIQGPPGSNGQSLYTWLKYADTPTTGMTDSPTGKKYMGLAYNKTSSTESNVYSDYTWSLIEGPKGDQGVPGSPGPNGQSLYTWVKYADTITGTGMSDSPNGKTYIGLAYNKTTANESDTATDYSWSLIQGAKGDQGVSVSSITPMFRSVARGAAAPAQPSGMAPAGWSATEPSWAPNSDLYRAERIVYSNNVITWTPATKVASYEGIDKAISDARDAHNEAVEAQQAATAAQNQINYGLNLVSDPSITKSTEGWVSNSPSTEFLVEDRDMGKGVVSALKQKSTGHNTIRSPYFKIDPAMAYEFRLTFDKPEVNPSGLSDFYFGITAMDEGGSTTTVPIEGIRTSNGSVLAASTNFYFWSAPGPFSGPQELVGYVLPVGTTADVAKGLAGSNYAARLTNPKTDRLLLRFLNYANDTLDLPVWVSNVSVRAVPVADLIRAKDAREAAEAAQDKADQAYTIADGKPDLDAVRTEVSLAANGKNATIHSTVSPNKDGVVEGDTWYRIDSNGNAFGMWTWRGGAWRPTLLRDEIIDTLTVNKVVGQSGQFKDFFAQNFTANTAVIDDLWANALSAKTVTTTALTVAAGDLNSPIAPNGAGPWYSGGAVEVVPNPHAGGRGWAFKFTNTSNWTEATHEVRIPYSPGDDYVISAKVTMAAGQGSVGARIYRYNDANSSSTLFGRSYTGPYNGEEVIFDSGGSTGLWSDGIGNDVKELRLAFVVQSGPVGGTITISDIHMRRKTGGVLIKNGAISADKVAAGAITTDKLKALAITAGKIAADAITTDKLAANAVNADKIAANTITATQINGQSVAAEVGKFLKLNVGSLVADTAQVNSAVIDRLWADGINAKTVTASKLTISTGNMIPDGDEMLTESQWAPMIRDTVDKPASAVAARKWAPGMTNSGQMGNEPITVEPGKEYSVQAWIKADKPGSRFYMEVRAVVGNGHGGTGRLEEPSVGSTGVYMLFSNQEVPTTWTLFRGTWTPDAGVTQVRFGSFYFNHGNGTEQAATVSIAGISMRPKVGSVLIENGAVNADKINAESVAAAVGTFVKIDVKNLTAGTANIDSLVAQKIAAGTAAFQTVNADKIIASTGTMDTAVINQIWADGIAAKTIATSKLTVASTNLIPDPQGRDPEITATRTAVSGGWGMSTAGYWRKSSNTLGNNALRLDTGTTSVTSELIANQRYVMSFEVYLDSGTADCRYAVRYTNIDGSTGYVGDAIEAGGDTAQYTSVSGPGWTKVVRYWDAPATAVTGSFDAQVNSVTTATDIRLKNFDVRPQVGAVLIENGSVSANHLTSNSVDTTHLRAEAVDAGKIKAGAVTTEKMVANTIDGDRIRANTLDAGKITANTITATQIKARAISAAEIATRTLLAENIVAGTITANEIKARTITAAEILGGTITANELDVTNISANTAMIDGLWANGISAKSINAATVHVGSADNLLPGTNTWSQGRLGGDLSPWSSFGINTGDPSVWLRGPTNGNVSYPVRFRKGVRYRFEVDVRASVTGTKFFWEILTSTTSNTRAVSFSNPSGQASAAYPFNSVTVVGTDWNTFWGEGVANEDADGYIRFYGNHPSGAANASGYQWFRNPRIQAMTGSTLIEGGAIKTEHLTVNSIDGDRIKAGTITADKIVSGSFEGKTFTGGLFVGAIISTDMLASTVGGLHLSKAYGLRAWDSTGRQTVTLDPSSGSLRLAANVYMTDPASKNGVLITPVSPSGNSVIYFSRGESTSADQAAVWRGAYTTGRNPLEMRGANGAGVNVHNGINVVTGMVEAPNTMFLKMTAADVQVINPPTSSWAANAVFDESGRLYSRLSSREVKKNIVDWRPEKERVLALRPRQWQHSDPNWPDIIDERWHVGFIAEEVHDAGLYGLVEYKGDGKGGWKPRSLSYERFSAAQQIVLQDHEARVRELESLVEELKKRLDESQG